MTSAGDHDETVAAAATPGEASDDRDNQRERIANNPWQVAGRNAHKDIEDGLEVSYHGEIHL